MTRNYSIVNEILPAVKGRVTIITEHSCYWSVTTDGYPEATGYEDCPNVAAKKAMQVMYDRFQISPNDCTVIA